MRRLIALGMVLTAAHLGSAAAGEQKPATIPELIRELSSNDFHARQHAARQLGNLGLAARDAVPALGKALHDNFPEVRGSAGKALGQIGTPAVGELVKALKDRDAGIRTRAAQALGQAGPDAKEAVPALIDALKDTHSDVRVAAVDALGEMGAEGKEAAPKLAHLFHDPSGRIREHVRKALAEMGPAAVEPLCDALGEESVEGRLDAIKTIALFGSEAKKAVPALRHAMKDEDHHIRAAAAEALGKMELDGAEAVPELLKALQDKKLDVQSEAVTALVLLTSAGVPDLLAKVREADRKGRWVVPLGVAHLAAKPRLDLVGLVNDLRSKDPQVRAKASILLGELGPKAEPAYPLLRKLLDDEDPLVRLSAAMVLAHAERKKVELVLAPQLAMKEAQRLLQNQLEAIKRLRWQVALSDPLIQAQVRQVVMFYISVKSIRAFSSAHTLVDAMLEQLGPEAVPALVEGINFVAANQIGFC